MTGGKPVGKWKAPRDGFVKINFDGALNKDLRLGGFGAVARDFDGEVLGALAGRESFVIELEMTEGFAVRRALAWAKAMGFSCVIVEGDALSLVNKLNAMGTDLSCIGHLVEDFQENREGLQPMHI